MEGELSQGLLAWARAAFIMGAGIVVAVAVRLAAPRFAASVFSAAGVKEYDKRLVAALTLLIVVAILIASGYTALSALELTAAQQEMAGKIALALVTALATLVAIRLVAVGFEAYVRSAQLDGAAAAYVSLLRKIVQVALIVIGTLLILDQLGYKATTLLAGVGLASLGVGLALQDTMSNFFAGIWIAMDRPVTRGDYVELDSGQAGFVEEIGWRHCKLRTWDDTIVVVPNARLASAVLVNRSLPQPEMSVYVECGVAYESDLEQVERTCIQVAREIQERVEGAVADWQPFVLFDSFADENITFTVALRVGDPRAYRLVRHEFIKALKAAFDEQGIEINYPVRTIYLRGSEKGIAPRLDVHSVGDLAPERSRGRPEV